MFVDTGGRLEADSVAADLGVFLAQATRIEGAKRLLKSDT